MASPLRVKRVGFVISAACPVYTQHQTFPDPGDFALCQERPYDTHTSRRPRWPAQALPSTKSGLFQPFEHLIPRLLRTELSGERPGVKEWP
jgi:hypothetical protein